MHHPYESIKYRADAAYFAILLRKAGHLRSQYDTGKEDTLVDHLSKKSDKDAYARSINPASIGHGIFGAKSSPPVRQTVELPLLLLKFAQARPTLQYP